MVLSKNPLWDWFGWRVLAHTPSGGADFGECLTTLERVGEGTAEAWCHEWTATAERLAAAAYESETRWHFISAREAYFRASNYHHAAYLPLFGAPADARLAGSFQAEVTCFQRAAALCRPAVEAVEIPFEGRTLPGYFARASSEPGRRPTVVQVGGYDSNIQEMYFAHGPAALRRGFNCLVFDGPGQGRNLIRDGQTLRPDWERVVSAVIDFVLTRVDVDPWRIVLAGWGLGGFLATRAAAFEGRIAALVADPGQWDQSETVRSLPVSRELLRAQDSAPPASFEQYERWLRSSSADPLFRWRTVQRGMWVHGVQTLFGLLKEIVRYEISPVAGQISCPTLLTAAEGDPLSRDAQTLFDALQCPKMLVRFVAAEGGGGHCEMLARSLYQQRVYDWLDETLGSGGCLPLGRQLESPAKPEIPFDVERVFRRGDVGLPLRTGGGSLPR